jgi:hypothetical protein
MQRDATQLGIAVDLMNRIEARYNFVRDLLRVRRAPSRVPFFAFGLFLDGLARNSTCFFGARVFLWCAKKEHSDDDELVSEYTRALWCELVDLSDAWHELNSDLAELNDEHELNSQRELELELELGPEEQEEDQCLEGSDDLD